MPTLLVTIVLCMWMSIYCGLVPTALVVDLSWCCSADQRNRGCLSLSSSVFMRRGGWRQSVNSWDWYPVHFANAVRAPLCHCAHIQHSTAAVSTQTASISDALSASTPTAAAAAADRINLLQQVAVHRDHHRDVGCRTVLSRLNSCCWAVHVCCCKFLDERWLLRNRLVLRLEMALWRIRSIPKLVSCCCTVDELIVLELIVTN